MSNGHQAYRMGPWTDRVYRSLVAMYHREKDTDRPDAELLDRVQKCITYLFKRTRRTVPMPQWKERRVRQGDGVSRPVGNPGGKLGPRGPYKRREPKV